MAVTVRFFAAARSAAGTAQIEAEPGTLASLLAGLVALMPGLQEVLPRCSFLVNGIAVHGDPAEVTVESGAELDVLPPFAGG